MKILAIGFLPPPLGGVSVSFEIFCDLAARNDGTVLEVVNLSARRPRHCLLRAALAILKHIWTGTARNDVAVLYCATPQVATIGLATLAMCRLRRKPLVLRKAASMDVRALGPLRGRVAEFVVKRADLFLAQTQQLAELCRRRGLTRTRWFPTSRPLGPVRDDDRECRRFVYIGQIKPTKGAFELIEAAQHLPPPATLDVYGPLFAGVEQEAFAGSGRIAYRGVLEPGEVVATLARYDAFVLPSKARSEGYPGAILEAFSVGLPVIATTVGGIPEIVDERCGILVAPGDTEALVRAMRRLSEDQDTYQRLCRGAREARERFSAEYWTDWLVGQCRELKARPGAQT